VPHPAENRKVGGSIPSLPTRLAQVSGLPAGAPPLVEPPDSGIFRHGLWLPEARRIAPWSALTATAGPNWTRPSTLLPDQRPPCSRCGSLARRFEWEITDTVVLSNGGTATDALSVAPTDDPATIAHAQPATLTVTAHDATTAQTIDAHGILSADQVGDATVVRGHRIIRDHLVVQGRSLIWTQLTEESGWLLQVKDEAGEQIATAVNDDPVEALAAVAEFILPGHPG
jgi:hypothetical protein